MREMAIEEIKLVELNILKYVDEVCRRKGIKYFLDAGTLLGSVRHKGFIPWDDDIDILVPREDYEKFFEAFKDGRRYKMYWYKNIENYYLPFGKVCDTKTKIVENSATKLPDDYGIFIDVFPLDYYPNNAVLRKIYILKSKWFRLLWSRAAFKTKNDSLKNLIANLVVGNKNPLFYAEVLDKYVSKYLSNKAIYARNMVATVAIGKPGLTEWFRYSEKLDFEGQKFSVPIGYDEYLILLYGNYMELPPLEERKYPHAFKAYYMEEN